MNKQGKKILRFKNQNFLQGKIDINNFTNFAVDKKFFWGVAKKVLKGENRERENISIAFVSPAIIKKLNKKYRKKDEPTDVLSFGKVLGFSSPTSFRQQPLIPNTNSESVEGELDLSEIIICPEVVKRNSKKFGTSFKKELEKILIHGILHILGYEHEKSEKKAIQMERKEKSYLSKIV